MSTNISWSSTAYLSCIQKTYHSISIELKSLDENYSGPDRTVDYYVNDVLITTVSLPSHIDNHEWTIPNLDPSTTYTIYARVTYYISDDEGYGTVYVGAKGKEEGIVITTYSEQGYAINASVDTNKITAFLDYDVWSYGYIDWFISTSYSDLFNTENKITDLVAPDMLCEFDGLTPGTTYYIGVIVYGDGNVVIEGLDDYLKVTTATLFVPSVKIVSMKRTSTEFAITIRNLAPATHHYDVYMSDSLASTGARIGGSDIPSGETATFIKTLSSGTFDGNDDRINALYIYIDGYYYRDGYGVDWYYPKSISTVRSEAGVEYRPFKTSNVNASHYIKVDISQNFLWDDKYESSTASPASILDYCFAPYVGEYGDVLDGGKHSDIYCSTNYHINSSASVMSIGFFLKYRCKICFQYYVKAQGSDVLTIELLYNDEVIDTVTDTGYSNKTWNKYSRELDAGECRLILRYNKSKSGSSSDDRAYFADFKITPCVPEAWDWEKSNGLASDTQTKLAYAMFTGKDYATGAAVEGKRLVSNVSHLVWNDMVNKVKHIADYYAGDYNAGAWDSSIYNVSYEDTLMREYFVNGKTLTAGRFNSKRLNSDNLRSTSIAEVESGEIVDGNLFVRMMEAINLYIEEYFNA